MKESILNKRFPTLLGLIMLIIGVALTSYLTQTGVILTSKASPAHTPENIRITNVTDTSFTVTYTTSDKVNGILSYSKDKNLTQTAIDDRNQQIESLTPYHIHHLTVKGLMPATKYYFSITSGPDTFLNNGELFETNTAQKISATPSTQQPIAGKIITADGKVPEEAIVYITMQDGQTLSSLVKKGDYIVPINAMKNASLISYMNFSPDTIINILAIGPASQSNASIYAKQVNPVPLITLSQNYDFTNTIDPVASSSAQFGFPTFTVTTTSSSDPKIISPKKDQALTDQKPLFKGTAQPSTNVTITIDSTEVTEKITSDSKGNWSHRPKQALSPGQHTITATTRDKFGISKAITQSFTIYAAGTQVNQTATPSATITIKPSSTPIPTLKPTATLVPTSKINPTPTLIPTGVVPTVIATPTTILIPTPTITSSKGGVVSGAQATPVANKTQISDPGPGDASTLIGFAALATTALGIVLFFFSRGSSL